MDPAFLHARIKLHWGFITRQLGASAAQLAYVLPPPPTVVGAFMNPLARILGLGEELNRKAGPAGGRAMGCALAATLAASAGLQPGSRVGVAVHAEPSRITASLYKTGGDYARALREPIYLASDRLLPVQAVGAASAPGGSVVLAWLLDLGKLSECLGTELGLRDLKAAAWSVYRLGSREGLVSVEDAGALDADGLEEVPEGGTFESILYQREDCVAARAAVRLTLYDEGYRERGYLAPQVAGGPSGLTPPSMPSQFTLRSGCRAVKPRGIPEFALAYRVIPGGGRV
ncbi:hypothetical protein [Stetteria hydrogenophila]